MTTHTPGPWTIETDSWGPALVARPEGSPHPCGELPGGHASARVVRPREGRCRMILHLRNWSAYPLTYCGLNPTVEPVATISVEDTGSIPPNLLCADCTRAEQNEKEVPA